MVEAPLIIVFFPLTLVWFAWMILFLANDPGEEIRHVKHRQFLGPGGPDDPFADEQWDELIDGSRQPVSEESGGGGGI